MSMIWAYGFRCFFLLLPIAAIGAVLPMPALWSGWLAGSSVDVALWHGHEQIFGFLTAALAGFLLTALPSWTGTDPVAGKRLMGLAGLWLAGRIAFWLDGLLAPQLVAMIDVLFLPALLFSILPAVVRPRDNKPWEFTIALAVLSILSISFHASRLDLIALPPERILHASLDMFLMLVAIAMGRILPVTMKSALVETGGEAQVRMAPGRRHLSSVTIALFAMADLALANGPVAGWIALAAACAQADRMSELHHGRALLRPQVFLFYLSQAWMVVGFGGIGLAFLGVGLNVAAMRHALGLGAATMAVMAVMSVVSLRHTARPFPLPPCVWLPPALAFAAAALRILVPQAWPQEMAVWGVAVPALLWGLAFLAWLVCFGRWLLTPRLDGKAG